MLMESMCGTGKPKGEQLDECLSLTGIGKVKGKVALGKDEIKSWF